MNIPKMEIEAIIFDFDGVLVESVNIKGAAFVELYKNENIDIQAQVLEYHNKHGGVTRYDKIRHYEKTLCGRDVVEDKVMELAGDFSDIVEDCVVKSPWVIGAKDFLEKHYKNVPFYVASATPEDELKRIVKSRNMDGYFKGIYGAPKRKDEHIDNIMAKNNYIAKHVLMIGDAMSDYEAAQKTGTHFIGRKLPAQASPFPDGTLLINDLTELESLIELK